MANRKKEYLHPQQCINYEIHVVYTLRPSKSSRKDRFNTKEIDDWIDKQANKARQGYITRVGECLDYPGDRTFRTMRNHGMLMTNRALFTRRFIVEIKDINTNELIRINLNNVVFDDEGVFQKIIEDFDIPEGWITRHEIVSNMIGKSFKENTEYLRQLKNSFREKKGKDAFHREMEAIGNGKGNSKYKYDTLKFKLRNRRRYHQRIARDCTKKLAELREYWKELNGTEPDENDEDNENEIEEIEGIEEENERDY